MSILDKNLLPDEQITFRTKKSMIIFLIPVILTLFTLFFLVNSNPYVFKISFLPAIAAAISWLTQSLLYNTSEFAVTTKRIIMREGFFIRHTNDTRLSTIANISVDQGLLGQMLDYGTVILHAFGGDADPFMQIAAPNEFRKQMQIQLDRLGK